MITSGSRFVSFACIVTSFSSHSTGNAFQPFFRPPGLSGLKVFCLFPSFSIVH